jgi:hypothetical protein
MLNYEPFAWNAMAVTVTVTVTASTGVVYQQGIVPLSEINRFRSASASSFMR